MTAAAIIILSAAVILLGCAVIAMARNVERVANIAADSSRLSTRLASDVISWSADVRALHRSLKQHHTHACHLDSHLRDLDRYVQGLAKLVLVHEKQMDDQRRQRASHADWPSLSARLALVEMRVMPAIDDWPARTRANEIESEVVALGGADAKKEAS